MYSDLLKNEVSEILRSYGYVDLRIPLNLVTNLVFMYHVIKSSENLLDRAYGMEKDLELGNYFYTHSKEEQNHAEWLAEDLKSAGVDVSKTLIPNAAVEMCGSVYYHIFHTDPAALLGYMLVLECFPMPVKLLEELEAIHGSKLLRTLKYHSTHDPEHAKDLQAQIDGLPNSRLWIVSQVAVKTAHYIARGLAGVFHGRP
jgi:hypothetical protein